MISTLWLFPAYIINKSYLLRVHGPTSFLAARQLVAYAFEETRRVPFVPVAMHQLQNKTYRVD